MFGNHFGTCGPWAIGLVALQCLCIECVCVGMEVGRDCKYVGVNGERRRREGHGVCVCVCACARVCSGHEEKDSLLL